MKKYSRTKENLVFENKFIQLFNDDVLTPSGRPGKYVRLRYQGNPPGIVVIPRLGANRFLLLNVFRYAMDELSIEFPRGTAEVDENAKQAAKREFKEETSLDLSSSAFTSLGFLRPDTAIIETEVEIFLVDVAEDVLSSIKLDEEIDGIYSYILLSREDIFTKIRTGEIRDGFTIGAVGVLAANQLL